MAKYRQRLIKVVDAVQHPGPRPLLIQGPEGAMTVEPGDWIITGPDGSQCPCKPAVFEALYELAA